MHEENFISSFPSYATYMNQDITMLKWIEKVNKYL